MKSKKLKKSKKIKLSHQGGLSLNPFKILSSKKGSYNFVPIKQSKKPNSLLTNGNVKSSTNQKPSRNLFIRGANGMYVNPLHGQPQLLIHRQNSFYQSANNIIQGVRQPNPLYNKVGLPEPSNVRPTNQTYVEMTSQVNNPYTQMRGVVRPSIKIHVQSLNAENDIIDNIKSILINLNFNNNNKSSRIQQIIKLLEKLEKFKKLEDLLNFLKEIEKNCLVNNNQPMTCNILENNKNYNRINNKKNNQIYNTINNNKFEFKLRQIKHYITSTLLKLNELKNQNFNNTKLEECIFNNNCNSNSNA
jgi:hypothetical protein